MKPFHITKASVIIVIQLLVLSFLTLSLGLKSREAASETYFLSEPVSYTHLTLPTTSNV